MTVSILLHGVLGSALACLVFAVGLGCVRSLRDGELFAYAPGLLLVSVVALLVLLEAWLALLAATLLVLPLARVLSDRPRSIAARAARPAAWSLVPALGLALALGRVNHGPTQHESSSAYGDMLFYAGKVVAAGQSIVPFHDLTVAGERHVFVETSWVFLGAGLSPWPGFDPILFQAATAPAFLVTALAIGAGLLRVRAPGSSLLALAGLLAAACVAYPSWIAESPPVALAAPLAFAIYGFWRERIPGAWLGGLAAVVAIDLYLTKGFGLIPFAVVLAVVVARDHPQRALTYLAAGTALVATGAVAFAFTSAWLLDLVEPKFLPWDAGEGIRSQLETRSTQEVAPAALLAGQVLLAFALARARAFALLAALGASMAGNWLVGGHGFDITIGLSALLAAQFFAERPLELRRQAVLVSLAALALLLSSWFRDIAGVRAGFVLVTLLAIGLLLAFVRKPRPALAAACAAAVAVALAVGTGSRQTTLTPAAHDVWQEVHDVVPADGLVFTSLTGNAIAGDQGWNYYPALAGRQVYLAGWSNSPLLVDLAERRRRLELNRRVLAGAQSPRGLGLDEFSEAYAVLRASEHAPESFQPVYRNKEFALYRIES